MLTLKRAVNSMVEQLSAFASEVTRVALDVGTQGTLQGLTSRQPYARYDVCRVRARSWFQVLLHHYIASQPDDNGYHPHQDATFHQASNPIC